MVSEVGTGPEDTGGVLRLGAPAPDFEVTSTAGRLRLSDYQGRWVVFFAHPADFTPVCTSEVVRLSRMYPQFKRIGCEIIGLSADTRFTHQAWIAAIEKEAGIRVPFPMVDDPRMAVARLYGMVHPDACDSATARSTFVIDDEGRLRLILHYPVWVGRSVEELLRVVKALQLASRESVALPEGWHPGEALVRLSEAEGEFGGSRPPRHGPLSWLRERNVARPESER